MDSRVRVKVTLPKGTKVLITIFQPFDGKKSYLEFEEKDRKVPKVSDRGLKERFERILKGHIRTGRTGEYPCGDVNPRVSRGRSHPKGRTVGGVVGETTSGSKVTHNNLFRDLGVNSTGRDGDWSVS